MKRECSNSMAIEEQNPFSDDSLYCEEDIEITNLDEELDSLFTKEKNETPLKTRRITDVARREGVEWILRVKSHYGFSPLTAVLAVNYLDRFLFEMGFDEKDKPWMMQLVAVTCLSLAAKIEETHVPLLLDLQVEGTRYVFESKTIQRMEILILATLKWRMHPVTPLSFIHHIMTRLGLNTYLHFQFLRTCENLILSLLTDSRFSIHLPSVLATATMVHVIHQGGNATCYENQLQCLLKNTKEEVDGVISEMLKGFCVPLKRRRVEEQKMRVFSSMVDAPH